MQDRKEGKPGEIGTTRAAELFSAMGKTIAKRWRELTPQEMVFYTKAAGEDMKRYRREMDQYHTNLAENHRSNADAREVAAKEEQMLREQQRPAESDDGEPRGVASLHYASRNVNQHANESEEEALTLRPYGQDYVSAQDAFLSAINSSGARREQLQQQQRLVDLLRGQDQMHDMLEKSNSPSSRLQAPSSGVGSLAHQLSYFLTPQEQLLATLTSQNPPEPSSSSFELQQQQQQRQRMLLESQYIQAALDQERVNLATTRRVTQELQLRMQQQDLASVLQQQQQQQQAASSLANLLSQNSSAPSFSAADGLSSGGVSSALLQLMLQQQHQQRMDAGQQQQQHPGSDESDDGAARANFRRGKK